MLRHEDTGEIVGNSRVVDDAVDCWMVLGGADFWVWKVWDWSDGEPKAEVLDLHFDFKELTMHFKGGFD